MNHAESIDKQKVMRVALETSVSLRDLFSDDRQGLAEFAMTLALSVAALCAMNPEFADPIITAAAGKGGAA